MAKKSTTPQQESKEEPIARRFTNRVYFTGDFAYDALLFRRAISWDREAEAEIALKQYQQSRLVES